MFGLSCSNNPFMRGLFYSAMGLFFWVVCVFPKELFASSITNRYLSMSLEELMAMEVTSAFKRPVSLKDTAAAVFVVTEEDIRRSGVVHFPELLRMVPGLSVAKVSSNKWAISIRGFNDEHYTSKILLLIDGRSVYSPIFPTVMWDENDIPLDEIERVEVVRGPGGAVWGANAVNGIINIITKKAKDTQGRYLSIGGGNEERGFGYLRYGGRMGEDTFFRFYLNGMSKDSSADIGKWKANDDWYDYRGGGRVDWQGDRDQVSVMGDLHWSSQNSIQNEYSYTAPYTEKHKGTTRVAGGNINFNWDHRFSNDSLLAVHTYYQFSDWQRHDMDFRIDTFSVEAQYQFSPFVGHSLMVGGGYRIDMEDVDSKWYRAFSDPDRKDEIVNFFFQDEVSLIPERLLLTFGSKFEHNLYTGWEVQPSARILFKVSPKITLWGAVSRAVHPPDMFTSSMRWCGYVLPPTPGKPFPVGIIVEGNRDLASETMWAYELGGRFVTSSRMDFDVALFFNHYNHLFGSKLSSKPTLGAEGGHHLSYFVKTSNAMDGDVYGVELASNIVLTPWWMVKPVYTFTKMSLWASNGFSRENAMEIEHKTPQHQLSIRSLMNLPYNLELDLWLRYVGKVYKVDSYVAFDARIGWRPVKNIELSLVGRNLFDNQHPEFVSTLKELPSHEVERSIYAKVAVWF